MKPVLDEVKRSGKVKSTQEKEKRKGRKESGENTPQNKSMNMASAGMTPL